MRLRVSTDKKVKHFSENGFTDPSKAVLPLWNIFGYLYFVFSLQPYGHKLGRTGLLARLYVKFSCVLSVYPVVSWVRCGA